MHRAVLGAGYEDGGILSYACIRSCFRIGSWNWISHLGARKETAFCTGRRASARLHDEKEMNGGGYFFSSFGLLRILDLSNFSIWLSREYSPKKHPKKAKKFFLITFDRSLEFKREAMSVTVALKGLSISTSGWILIGCTQLIWMDRFFLLLLLFPLRDKICFFLFPEPIHFYDYNRTLIYENINDERLDYERIRLLILFSFRLRDLDFGLGPIHHNHLL